MCFLRCLLLSCALTLTVLQGAAAQTLEVQAGETVETLERWLVRAPDLETCPEDGGPLGDTRLDDAEVWGCTAVTNTGAESDIWRIDFNTTVGSGFTFWMVRGDEELQILTAPTNRTLSQLETGGPRLSSLPFPILPSETVEIWVKLDPGTRLPNPVSNSPALVPEARYDRDVAFQSTVFAMILAGSVLLAGFFFAFARLLESQPAHRYALYFLVATAVESTLGQGYAFVLFDTWPTSAIGPVTKLLELLSMALYFRFIASFAQEALGAHPVVTWARRGAWIVPLSYFGTLFLAGIGEGLVIVAGSGTLEPDSGLIAVARFLSGGFVMAGLATTALVWSVLTGWVCLILMRRGTEGAVLFTLGALVLLLVFLFPVGQGLVSRLFGWPVVDTPFLIVETTTFVDGLIFASAIVRQTFGLRGQRDAAVQAELAASQEKLALAEGLLAAQKDRDRAEALAERHRSRLALTSHDMRQPLTSLRLALAEAEREAPQLRDRLATSLDYLKSVLDDAIEDARPMAVGPGHEPAPSVEPVPLALIFENTRRMFETEAQQKGLALSIGTSDLIVSTDAVSLIRSLSNLVSNAIKYTATGAVSVSGSQSADGVVIAVQDTGPGLTADQIAVLRQAYRRGGEDTEGEGIGLTSVQDIAAEQGWTLTIDSTPGEGSTFSLRGLALAPT